jgi:putative transposase
VALWNFPLKYCVAAGGYIYHVLNRAVGRFKLFPKATDFDAYVRVHSEAHERLPISLLAYCILWNTWHLVLWPRKDGDLSGFMRWLTVMHAQRWHACLHTPGTETNGPGHPFSAAVRPPVRMAIDL